MNNKFLVKCGCGRTTSRSYYRAHGKCKACEEPSFVPRVRTREQTIIDHGWDAYAREEGHYDLPDYA